MRPRAALLFPLFALFSSGCGSDPEPFAPPDPTTCAVYLWEPGDGELETWPAMEYLVPDATRATGYRFELTLESYPVIERYGQHAHVALDQLPTLDGFGVNAALFAEFSRPFAPDALPAGDGAVRVADPAGIVVLDAAGGPVLHPVQLSAVEDSDDLPRLLTAIPMRPLPSGARAAFFVTTGAAAAAEDGCVSPSIGMRGLVDAPDADMEDALDALVALGVIDHPHDLAVLQPFVTQTVYDESAAVAADIASRPDEDFELDVDAGTDCTDAGAYRHCVALLEATDYRNADGFVELDPAGEAIRQSTYTLRVHVFIPDDQDGAAPTLLFGHGLSGSTEDHASQFLPHAAEDGVVIVGIDALEHGDHPTSDGLPGLSGTLAFFAVTTEGGPRVDALRLRDHFRQSTYDKLQVTRAILASPDLDHDGTIDVDVGRMGYVGVSLGAIMGAELLALTDAYESAVLAMPGGRVSAIVEDEESVFAPLKPILLPSTIAYDPAESAKLFAVLQTVLDRGDAASFAARVLDDRFDFAPAIPDVLALVALDDDVVPNAENYAFARAMGLGVVPPLLREAPGLALLTDPPLAGNVAGGEATAGLLQFDQVELDGGEVTLATHTNLGTSVTARAAIFPFFRGAWETGVAEIVDPYEATGLPHLAP